LNQGRVRSHSGTAKFGCAGLPPRRTCHGSDQSTARLDALAKYGVEAYVPEITFKPITVDVANLNDIPYLRTLASGVATVAELQGKGHAYLKIG
jgi:intracellular sulfur oxidation DsrE/DsrF family protein